jgi:hypothetical protein
LIGRHEIDERRFGHRLQRIVRSSLLADRRDRFLTDRFAAQRSRAVRRIHEARVGQRQQLLLQRVVQQSTEI